MQNPGQIKTFLSHKDPKKLTDLMIKNNITRRCYHVYDIVFANGIWYAWFEVDIGDSIMEKINNVSKSKG